MPLTTDISPPSKGADEVPLRDSVGRRLQRLRKHQGISQRELARRAEVTNSTLSMIEQGKVSPSVASLEKILRAFPISLQEFFSASFQPTPAVFRSDDFIHTRKGLVDYRIMPLPYAGKEGLYLAHQRYPPGANVQSEWMVRNGFVGGLICEGELELRLDDEFNCLKQGDGFYFSMHRDHAFVNHSPHDCIVVCVSLSEPQSD